MRLECPYLSLHEEDWTHNTPGYDIRFRYLNFMSCMFFFPFLSKTSTATAFDLRKRKQIHSTVNRHRSLPTTNTSIKPAKNTGPTTQNGNIKNKRPSHASPLRTHPPNLGILPKLQPRQLNAPQSCLERFHRRNTPGSHLLPPRTKPTSTSLLARRERRQRSRLHRKTLADVLSLLLQRQL